MTIKASVIAVIPARGGSKGIRLKNIALLGDKTLLEHTIGHALKSRLLSRIIVSTDDERIMKVASRYKKYNIEISKRPPSLARDNTPMISVLKHVLHELKQKKNVMPGLVVTLQPTSPFRDPSVIDRAIKIACGKRADSVIALCRAEHSPYKMFRIKSGRLKRIMHSEFNANNNRQLYPAVYRESGVIYVSRSELIINKNRVIGGNTAFLIVDNFQSFDIDEPLDLEIARQMIKNPRIK